MQGADVRKSAAGADNGKRCSRLSPEEEYPGIFFGGITLLLLFGVEIVKYGFAVIDFVNHVVQRAHNNVGVHMAVVRHERADIT